MFIVEMYVRVRRACLAEGHRPLPSHLPETGNSDAQQLARRIGHDPEQLPPEATLTVIG